VRSKVVVVVAQGIHADLFSDVGNTQFNPLVAGLLFGSMASFAFIPSDVTVGRGRASFGLSMFLLGVFTAVASAFVTWVLDMQIFWSGPSPQFGWSLRLADSLVIAVGNTADIVALGPWPRVLGTLFVASAVFLPVAAMPVIHRLRMRHQRRQ